MPVFAVWMGALFGQLAGFLAKFMAIKFAIRTTAATAIVGFTIALMALFNSVVAPLVAQAFSTQYGTVIGLAFPPVAGTCLAAIVTVWTACGTYRMQVGFVKMSAGV